MVFVETDAPKGTIIIPTEELSRYTDFWLSMQALQAPVGTTLFIGKGNDIARNLNDGLRRRTGEWVFIMGDDHVFPGDLLVKLLARKVDYVSPFCVTRKPPHLPIVFTNRPEHGTYDWFVWEDLDKKSGLMEVDRACGVALISENAISQIDEPWYVVGRGAPDVMGEDLYLMQKLRELGIKVHVDLDNPIGHMNPVTIWPRKDEQGIWAPWANFGGNTWAQLGKVRRTGQKIQSNRP